MFFPSVTVEVRKSDKVQQMRCKNCICLFSGNDILLTEVKENYDMQRTQHTPIRMADLALREQEVFGKIPGIQELLHAPAEKWNDM